MIAAFRRGPKLAVFSAVVSAAVLALAGCAGKPYGVPRAAPGFPIVTSGYFHLADGAVLPYRLYPARGRLGAVVLALHGYTDSRDGWAMLAKVLNAHGIAVYAPDQSGFGATPDRGAWPGTARLVDEARDMSVLLRRKYPDQKLFVAGESMGGAIGLLLGASADPPPVDGYILSAPAVWGGAALGPFYHAVLDMADTFVPGMRLTGQAAHVLASDNIAALIAFSRDPLTLLGPTVANIAGMVRLMGDAQAACAALHEPALILYGGHDELIPKAAMRRCWDAIPRRAPVTLAYYPPDYHLITRDLERATPDADILGYILGTGPVSSAPSEATVFLASGAF